MLKVSVVTVLIGMIIGAYGSDHHRSDCEGGTQGAVTTVTSRAGSHVERLPGC